VYGSPKVHGHFQGAKFIWCTVGQTPDIMALYQTLSAELGLKPEKNVKPEDSWFWMMFGKTRHLIHLT
jgi:hypothetical protein